MKLLKLALQSLRYRLGTVLLSAIAIAISVFLFLAVERIRTETREGFSRTISGTDLILAARGHPIQILLVSVFHIGYPTNNINWSSYEDVAANPAVAWTVPLSLGDSHRGYRVIGTTKEMFEHLKYGRRQSLQFATGGVFAEAQDAVLGSNVAKTLGYQIGSKFDVGHGLGDVSFVEHKDHPFSVTGILAPTGTPIDNAIYVSLEGYDKMHESFFAPSKSGAEIDPLAEAVERNKPSNRKISAVLIGLKSRQEALFVQRSLNDYKEEPLTAVMPAVTLQELWQVTGVAERALILVSGFVVVVGLFGMATTLLAGMNERRREMAILRSVGARPGQIFGLLLGEALLVTLLGILLGVLLLIVAVLAARSIISAELGMELSMRMLSSQELVRLGLVLLAGVICGAIPAYRVYRQSLADGLLIRL